MIPPAVGPTDVGRKVRVVSNSPTFRGCTGKIVAWRTDGDELPARVRIEKSPTTRGEVFVGRTVPFDADELELVADGGEGER